MRNYLVAMGGKFILLLEMIDRLDAIPTENSIIFLFSQKWRSNPKVPSKSLSKPGWENNLSNKTKQKNKHMHAHTKQTNKQKPNNNKKVKLEASHCLN